MSAPFLQLYVGDYLADTLDLTTEQHGAYLLLLMTMWRHEARLPNDPAKLARIARVSPRRWHLVWEAIEKFFFVDGDQIGNKRLDREHQKAVSISQKRSASGEKGGRAKALKNNDQRLANASDLLKHSQISDIRSQKEERKIDGASAPDKYAFVGKNFRVTHADLEKWREAYWRIADITSELTKCDDYYTQSPKPDGKYYFAVSSWLEREHKKLAGLEAVKTDWRNEPAYRGMI